MKTVGVISLGCSKNTVDTERMLGLLQAGGYRIVTEAKDAQVLIVNTCGFINPAKQESIDTILEMAQYKTSGSCEVLVATGCLIQRYRQELKQELPEVDLFLGVNEYDTLLERLSHFTGEPAACPSCQLPGPRVLITPSYSAYLRIADGCDNCCTYCAIPLIRGQRNSVPMEKLVAEAEQLAQQGVKELTVIAQDTSGYGIDLYGKPMLRSLLEQLDQIESLKWIRVLYTYPNTVDEDLIDFIHRSKHVVPYLDMPIQHINDNMLRKMNRHGESKHIREILAYVRRTAPEFILRSTVIVGFPAETTEEFDELLEFLQEQPLDRLGAFTYSAEDGTPAAEYAGQWDEKTKQQRLDAVMRQQQKICLERNRSRIGSITEVLVEGQTDAGLWVGRSYAEAPDVDGKIYFTAPSPLAVGSFVQVRLTRETVYDMYGEKV